ncbi:nuclease-related domain-containing protein [Nonomuraea sp. NPDC049709]|uniref:nuclease-related domain-containing protein n=1 Tax=Nonomuraea sp. NPDC049709 TaxID=3154736 RepID=UPI003425170D
MARPRASGASASALAQYRTQWRAGRPRRLLVQLTLSAAALAVVAWVWNWQAGLAAAAVVALADTLQRWRVHSPAAGWCKGARGERATARRLRSLELAGYAVLHDRRLPRSKANIGNPG